MVSMYATTPIHVRGKDYAIGDEFHADARDSDAVHRLRKFLRAEPLTAADRERYQGEYERAYGIEQTTAIIEPFPSPAKANDATGPVPPPTGEDVPPAVRVELVNSQRDATSAKPPRRKVTASRKLPDGKFHVTLKCGHELDVSPHKGKAPKSAACPACLEN